MHRLGFQPSDVPEVVARLKSQTGVMARSIFASGRQRFLYLRRLHTKQLDDTFTKAGKRSWVGPGKSHQAYPQLSRHRTVLPEYQMDMVRSASDCMASAHPVSKDCATSAHFVPRSQIQNVPAGDPSVTAARPTSIATHASPSYRSAMPTDLTAISATVGHVSINKQPSVRLSATSVWMPA